MIDAAAVDGNNLRNNEFTCNPDFARSLAEEIVPWIETNYSVYKNPFSRIIAGSSFGGLFSAYFAFTYPDIVVNVLSQSGSSHWGKEDDGYGYEWLIQQFAFTERRRIYLWMEVGKLEGEYHWHLPDFPNQIVSHRHLTTILEMKCYNYTYREYAGGHDMLSWKIGLSDGLVEIANFRGWND
jgi:enterochelin esterase family protein